MKETIEALSRKLNLSSSVIENAYKAYFLFIRKTAEQFPFKEDMDEKVFNKLRPNFNIPNLGKLACTYNRYTGMKKKNQLMKKKHVEYKEN